ncbi:c-type cytochrome [Alisedimentitalea sp. MJ-SS2]|uniref:c-type cytochrome n=1 Tax=Aliisedimentitalea sp. MJ-SS2 TaxID=3049795 RepID=UPI0029064A26|nr:c-type cytochrome [Alisedimentitalea sp. MJ-SS2]MDU8929075.1 c-type cytochrome [Alisedimentitalea sp. MJ-SS2]
MSKFLKFVTVSALAAVVAAPAMAAPKPKAEKLGLGRVALPEEVAAWDLDVSPDGTGLPHGSGSVLDGEEIFAEQCAICHGDFAEGVDNWPKLAGGADTLDHKDPLKTVGSYWPYLSTAFDYVNRSMPFGQAQTLRADETYAMVAYILYSNDMVDEDFVLSNENFLDVEMPNADGFIVDDRDTSEAHFWGEPCMSNCKPEPVKITMRAAVLDVTPEDAAAREAREAEATTLKEGEAETLLASASGTGAATESAQTALDPALVKAGEKVFKKCKACHQVGEKAKNKTGPVLNGVMGRGFASVDGFKYSKTIKAMGEEGMIWDEANMAEFLKNPKAFIKKTKMSFAGLKKDEDAAAVIEYLKSFPE